MKVIARARTEVSRSTANFYRPEIDNSRDSRGRAVPSTFVKRDREGNFEQIERSRNGTNDVYNYRRTKLDRNIPTEQRSNGLDRREETNPAQEMQRREYQPSQRSKVFESQNRTRTYERSPQENQNTTRDRYEAPPIGSRHLQIVHLKMIDNPGNGDKWKLKPPFARGEACSLIMNGILRQILPGPEAPAATHNVRCNSKSVNPPGIKHPPKSKVGIVGFENEIRFV